MPPTQSWRTRRRYDWKRTSSLPQPRLYSETPPLCKGTITGRRKRDPTMDTLSSRRGRHTQDGCHAKRTSWHPSRTSTCPSGGCDRRTMWTPVPTVSTNATTTKRAHDRHDVGVSTQTAARSFTPRQEKNGHNCACSGQATDAACVHTPDCGQSVTVHRCLVGQTTCRSRTGSATAASACA